VAEPIEPDRGRPAPVVRIDQFEPTQVLAAAGTAMVTAVKVGRLLGRSGWRIARQLPGGQRIEREAKRMQAAAADELRRMLDAQAPSNSPEHRAAVYIRNADPDTAPLRSAMGELLERSAETSRSESHEYLYGTIISQLVPDEARILAALADGTTFAAADVVAKRRGRANHQVVLANASTVGRAAGVVSPDNVPTYVTRLAGFGLIATGPADEDRLSTQYDILATDATVQAAEATVGARRLGSPRIARKTISISAFGRDFWAACDPTRAALPPGT
jgi:hypothetical protein